MNPQQAPNRFTLNISLCPQSPNLCPSLQPPKCQHLLLPNLEDSHSTAHSSYLFGSKDAHKHKFYSFKRIKQSKIRQKQQVGETINRRVVRNRSYQKHKRIQTLDDVKTIESHLSPKSDLSMSRCVIEESIIVMRGNGMNQIISQDPPTPFFRKTKSFKHLKRLQSQFLKVIPNQQLVYCLQSGLLCHYQLFEGHIEEENFKLGDTTKHTNILECYGICPLYSSHSLVLFQPYTQTLDQFFRKQHQVQLKSIIQYLIQITKVLCHLRNSCIYPILKRSLIYFSNKTIKIKIIPGLQMHNQRQMIEESGRFFLDLIVSLEGQYLVEGNQYVSKIKGMSIDKKIELIDLMNQFIFNDNFSLEEGYLKLQAFNC